MPVIIDNSNSDDAFSSFNFAGNWLTITLNLPVCNPRVISDIVKELNSHGFTGVEIMRTHGAGDFTHLRSGEVGVLHSHLRFSSHCNIEDQKNIRKIFRAISHVQKKHIEKSGKTTGSLSKLGQFFSGRSHCSYRLLSAPKAISKEAELTARFKASHEKRHGNSPSLCFFNTEIAPQACHALPAPTGISTYYSLGILAEPLFSLVDNIAENPVVMLAILGVVMMMFVNHRTNRFVR